MRIIIRIVRMSRAYSRLAQNGNPFLCRAFGDLSRQNHYPGAAIAIDARPTQFPLTSKCMLRGENNFAMPEEDAIERAREDEREGLSPSTQAGEFVREEMEQIREGEHGARSPEQAIAIGLSKARRAGVKLPPPKRGKGRTKRQAQRDIARGRAARRKKPSTKRSRATKRALKRESRRPASRQALSRHAKRVAKQRSARSRSAAAKKAARTRKRRR